MHLKPNELEYTYLRNEDKLCVEAIIKNSNYHKLYVLFVLGGIKRKISNLLGIKSE